MGRAMPFPKWMLLQHPRRGKSITLPNLDTRAASRLDYPKNGNATFSIHYLIQQHSERLKLHHNSVISDQVSFALMIKADSDLHLKHLLRANLRHYLDESTAPHIHQSRKHVQNHHRCRRTPDQDQ